MKRLTAILWILLWSHLGFFAGYAAYGYWHYRANPGLYALQSAPWYVSLFPVGLYTLAVALISAGILLVLRGKTKE